LTFAYEFGKVISHLVHIKTIKKGHKLGFLCKQGSPMAFYEGALVMDPNPPVN
jgi:hypothetical protein